MGKPLIIYGAGGFAREVVGLVQAINNGHSTWEICGYVSDNPAEFGRQVGAFRVLGSPQEVLSSISPEAVAIVIAMGSPERIKTKSEWLRAHFQNIYFPAIIHPTVSIDHQAVAMGQGNIIAGGCLFTTDIRIGSFNLVNLGCIVAHDVVLRDYCVVNPRVVINGQVELKSNTMIGAGAVIMPRISIGEGAVVALGAVVGTDVEPYTVVAGNPARVVRRLPAQD
jgi:sugar O-acyltransferase (sialic acid O-acetyltransferase NeuD family)